MSKVRIPSLIILIALVSVLSTSLLWGQITINGSGNYATIQAAINVAGDGDDIQIGGGTYNEALTIGKSLTFIGSGPASSPTTIITSTASRIINLTVTGMSFSFQNLIIEGNLTNNGIYAGSSIDINSLTMQDVIARNCQVGLYLAENWPGDDPLTTVVTTLSLDNVTLTNNKFIGAYIGKTVLSGTVTNSTITGNGYSNDLPGDWQKTGLQFVNFDEASVPHVVVTNCAFSNNGTGASNIERTGLIIYTAYNAHSANEIMTVSGCAFSDHPQYAVRIKNGYNVGNTATINGTFTNNYLDIWFNNIIGATSSTTLVRRTFAGTKTVGTGPTYDYNTIQEAISAAAAGDVIEVAAGTYTEDILINKPLTLNGANANVPYGSGRGVESKLQPFTNGGAAINLSGAGTSDYVTINGFEITGTTSNNAIYCGGDGPSNLNITFNYIHDIGTARGSGNVYAINYRVNNPSTTDINVSDNYINEVFNTTSGALGHSAAIWFGQSTANGTVSNLTIAKNTIRNVKSGLSTKEANGIYIGVAWGAGTGSVVAPIISNNSITDISGGIAYGIQLSGKTPGAVVSNNIIDNINNGALATSAAFGVGIPNTNTGSATVVMNGNSFTNVLYAAANGTPNGVNASGNWWGDNTPAVVASKISGAVDYTPWLNSGTDTDLGTPGFQGDFSNLWVGAASPQTGSTGRIQEGINLVSGSTVNVAAGTYVEGPQVLVNKNVTIIGADKLTTIITPSANTGNSGDARGWFLVNTGFTFNLSNVTLDGTGRLVYMGILHKGNGTVSNCKFMNIKYNESGGDYAGMGMSVRETPNINVNVTDCDFSGIGRIGVHYRGPHITGTFSGNTYTGKGVGNWLDYGVEAGGAPLPEGGAQITISNNTISNCKGVASDGSTSAGILVTTYFGPGTTATITGCTLTNNTAGIVAGYDAADASVVIAHNNNFIGNTFGIESTNPVVNATLNWWGSATGPTHSTNPGGTGDAVTDHVSFDPWIGKGETVSGITQTSYNYDFTNNGVTINFSTLPPGGGSVTVSKYLQAPPNPPYPAPPSGSTYLPLYLDISSTMANGTFSATVTVDVTGILGVGPTSQLLYYNSATSSWVSVGGTYAAGPPATFTFTTTHFTPFAFINTPATAKNVYVSKTTSAAAGTIYPNNTWGGGYPGRTDDWGFTGSEALSVYLVPEVGTQFGASDIVVEWDYTYLTLASVDYAGSMYSGGNVLYATSNQLGTNNRVTLNASLNSPDNVTIAAGQYIAKLNFTLKKPGHTSISIVGADFRYFNVGSAASGVYVTPHQAEVKAYLADVAAPVADQTTGDGKVDFQDLTPWSASYWSGVAGYPNGLTNYKAKYDIGPTMDGYVFSLPAHYVSGVLTPGPDQKIQFEDLVIFSIMYGLSANHQLPKTPAIEQAEPLTIAVAESRIVGNETFVPVRISGGVADVRALSMVFAGQFGRFIGASKGDLLQNYETPVALIARSEGSDVFVDLAVMGLDAPALRGEGEVVTLCFEGNASVRPKSADARGDRNNALAVTMQSTSSAKPTKFELTQNYPNPFNPTTTIEYEVVTTGNVEIAVYTMLGEKVATLVNEVKDAGFHSVVWNGSDDSHRQVATGVYFYSMRAGTFSSIKKMVLLK